MSLFKSPGAWDPLTPSVSVAPFYANSRRRAELDMAHLSRSVVPATSGLAAGLVGQESLVYLLMQPGSCEAPLRVQPCRLPVPGRDSLVRGGGMGIKNLGCIHCSCFIAGKIAEQLLGAGSGDLVVEANRSGGTGNLLDSQGKLDARRKIQNATGDASKRCLLQAQLSVNLLSITGLANMLLLHQKHAWKPLSYHQQYMSRPIGSCDQAGESITNFWGIYS